MLSTLNKTEIKGLPFLILFSLMVSSAFCQQKLSLQQAIDYAMEHNLDLKKSSITENILYQEVIKAKSDRYPNLTMNLAGQLNSGRSLDFTSYSYVNEKTLLTSEDLVANIVIFQGFQKTNQIKETKFTLEANKSNTQRIRNDITLNIIALYLKVLSLKDQLKMAISQDTLYLKQLVYTTLNFDMGKKSSIDVSRIKFQIAKNQLNITSIQNEFNNRKLDLIQLINLKPDTEIELVEPKESAFGNPNMTVQEIFKTSVLFLPEIKQADFSLQATFKQLEIAKGNFYPRLNLTVNATSNYSQRLKKSFVNLNESFVTQFNNNLYQYASLNLAIPIFNRFATKISVNQIKLKLETAKINQAQTKNDLYKAISKALGDFEAAKKTFIYSQEALRSSTETLNVIEQRYRLGSASSLDLNQALSDVSKAQLEIIQSKYEAIFRSKIIDFYLGKPISY